MESYEPIPSNLESISKSKYPSYPRELPYYLWGFWHEKSPKDPE